MGKENEGRFSGFWDVQAKCDGTGLSEAGNAAEEERPTALLTLSWSTASEESKIRVEIIYDQH